MSTEREKAGNKDEKAGNNPATSRARDMEKLINEQRARIEFLEEELRSRQEASHAGSDNHRDLSREHKQAEQALSESEERFRHLADFSPIPMAINDKDNNIIYLNKKFIEIFGYTREDIPHLKYWWPLAYPDPGYRKEVIKRWEKGIEEAVKGSKEIGPIDYIVTCKDGSVRYTEISGVPIGDKELVLLQDITERKQAERALRFTQFAVDKAGDEVYWIARDGRFHYVNEAACRALGYGRDELLQLTVYDIDPLEMPRNWPSKWKGIGETATFESIHRTRDGRTYPVEVVVKYICYDNMEFQCAFARDITERKRSDEARRFTQFSVDRAGEEIFWIAEDGRFHNVNDAACRVLGYTRDELLNLKVSDIDPEVTEENWPKFWERTKAFGTSTFETVHRTRAGKSYPVEITSNNLRYNQKEYHCAFARDITERKQAEEALQESEEKFKTIFNRAALGMAISNSAGVIIDCNSAYQEILGYCKEELLAKNFLDLTHGEDIANNRDLQQQMNDGLLDTYQIEKRYIHKNGKVVFCKLTASAIRNRDGSLKYNLAIAEDITERKRMIEELKAAKQQSELYLDLMGHDINNMNQIALGYLELAQNTLAYEGYLNRQHSMLLSKPTDTLRNASTLISNVRKLQREKTGQYALSNIDIDSLLRDIIRLNSSVPNRDVTINYEPCGASIVKANELLRDVFTNLVGNAIKHSDDIEKLLITIRVEKAVEKGTDYCKVSVEDNGHGIPETMKATLFDRLSLDITRARGKGFGLCLIKLLVDDYNGKFWVEDRVKGDHKKGARFVVMLPVVEN